MYIQSFVAHARPERLERKDKCDSVMLQAAKMEMSFVDGKVCLVVYNILAWLQEYYK